MKKLFKRSVCLLLAAALFCACGVSAFAVNEYMKHERWHAITATKAAEMFDNGDTFVLMCYRESCGNCKYIGANVVMEWMDTYDMDVYGVNVDAEEGVPSFVWTALGKSSATLPFVAFVRGGKAQAYCTEDNVKNYAEKLNDVFFAFYDEITRKHLTVLTMPAKTVYLTGDPLDTTGLTVQLTQPDGTAQTITEGFVCTGFSSDQPGHKTVTVSYDDAQTTFTVAVNTPDGKPSLWIEQPAKEKLRYAETTTLSADFCNLPEGAGVKWEYQYATIRGVRAFESDTRDISVTADGFTQNVTLTVSAVDADGNAILNENGEALAVMHTIRFRNNIFFRLKAFFDKLFGRGGCESDV